jgi:hypothetical protein
MSFLISWLPSWIFYLILATGVLLLIATLVLQAIPFIRQHLVPLQVASILLIVFGTWFSGGIAVQNHWTEKVNEMKLKVAQAELAAAEASAKIEYVYVDRVKVVKDIQYVVRNQIQESSNEIDANCKLNSKVIEILNRSASMENKK